jgi:hypothetical protein
MKKLFLVILAIVGPIPSKALDVSENHLENLRYINKFEDERLHQSKTLIRVGRDYSEDKNEDNPAVVRQNQPEDNIKLQLVNHKHKKVLSKSFPAVDSYNLKFMSGRSARNFDNESPITTETLLEPRMNDHVTILENLPPLNSGEAFVPAVAYIPVLVIPYPVYINESHNPESNNTGNDIAFDVKKPLFIVSTSGLHQGSGGGSHHGGSSNNHHSSFYNSDRPLSSGSYYRPSFYYRSNNPPPTSTGRPFVVQQTFKPFLQWRPISIQKQPQA